MSLFDCLQPKWKDKDAAIREQAVLGLKNQEILETIVNDDPSETVRRAAITRITDQKLLARVACRNDVIALAATKRLTDRPLLADVALRAVSRDVREFAVDVLDDHVVLHRIANSDTDARVRLKAQRKHSGHDVTRGVIQTELSRLQFTRPEPDKAPEFCGTIDEVCRALVSDDRFRISASVEANLPGQAAIRELDSGPATAPTVVADATPTTPSARFLALKRTGIAVPDDGAATRTYYEITVWRTGENTFHAHTQEKHLDMVVNPVKWSSVSNGATAEQLHGGSSEGR